MNRVDIIRNLSRVHERHSAVVETLLIYEFIENFKPGPNHFAHVKIRLNSHLRHRARKVFYSHLFSIFDTSKSAVNYKKLSKNLEFDDKKQKLLSDMIIQLFEILQEDLKKVRDKISAHYSKDLFHIMDAYESYHKVDFQVCMFIVEGFGLLFRGFEKSYPEISKSFVDSCSDDEYYLKWNDFFMGIKDFFNFKRSEYITEKQTESIGDLIIEIYKSLIEDGTLDEVRRIFETRNNS